MTTPLPSKPWGWRSRRCRRRGRDDVLVTGTRVTPRAAPHTVDRPLIFAGCTRAVQPSVSASEKTTRHRYWLCHGHQEVFVSGPRAEEDEECIPEVAPPPPTQTSHFRGHGRGARAELERVRRACPCSDQKQGARSHLGEKPRGPRMARLSLCDRPALGPGRRPAPRYQRTGGTVRHLRSAG
jgi:hypothetical protein